MSEHRKSPLPALRHIAIIGLGLIGGSIARGLRAAGYGGKLSGVVAGDKDVEHAMRLGLVDDCHPRVDAAIGNADLIIVATPPSTMGAVMARVAAHCSPTAVVTDTGSSKGGVIADARQVFEAGALTRFVPGHPIAGTENNGLDAGFAELFRDRRVLITPHETTADHAVARVNRLWEALGASVVTMTAAHHDEVLAATSHLPHVLAYAMVDTLAELDQRADIFANAAGGFADFTRIASSDAGLWRDIVAANRQSVVQTLDIYLMRLHHLRDLIADGEDEAVQTLFQRAQTAREDYMRQRESRHC